MYCSAALLLLGWLLRWPALFAHVHSHLLVPAQQQFRLGGEQAGRVVVVAHNVGPVLVELLEQPAPAKYVGRGYLRPGQRGRLQVGPRAAVLVRNASARQAVLEVDLYAEPGLTMTYDPAPAGRATN